MNVLSKEQEIIELFYKYPSRHIHFKDIQRKINVADNKIAAWLKRFEQQKLIQRVKKVGKMPYYIANISSVMYQYEKKIYTQKKLVKSGFIKHVCGLKGIETVIIFGSITRWDWHSESDIDIFLLGDDSEFQQGYYEEKLGFEIEVFSYANRKQLKKLHKNLLRNIIQGDIIKGDLSFLEVNVIDY